MSTNWGDIAIHEMARHDEERIRNARHLAQAGHYQPAGAKHLLAGVVQAIRQQFSKPRAADQSDANLNLGTHQKPA